MAENRYANAKCFVFAPDGYEEITYSELCRRREMDQGYEEKKFIPLHGMLMEVTPEQYREFYRNRRRQKYLDERSKDNGDISIDMLTTPEFNGADILVFLGRCRRTGCTAHDGGQALCLPSNTIRRRTDADSPCVL